MKTKINTQEVRVYRIKIDYIKPVHEGVHLLIEYYHAIPTTSTHKIYAKSTSLVPHILYSILLLHFSAITQYF